MERKKQLKNIGSLKGPVLVFGGVYSNLQALMALRKIAEDLDIPPTHVICTGDVVAYCAQPEECVQQLMDWGIPCIAGNVEIQLREGAEDCGCEFKEGGRCDVFSRQWYPFAQSQLSRSSIEWMKDLPDFIQFTYAGKKATVVHGSWHETADFIFESTSWEIKQKNFTDSDSSLILAGHCGLPFQQEKEGHYWVNAGVIGMPANDGTHRVWYAILEEDEKGELLVKHQALEYDFETASQLMFDLKLPLEYASTLKTGIWDNTEILPKRETKLTGITIQV